ncbi:MAG: hypothetical protein WD960_14305 [Gemmatimonadota bacterium]
MQESRSLADCRSWSPSSRWGRVAVVASFLLLSGCRLFLTPEEDVLALSSIIAAVEVEGGTVALQEGSPSHDATAPRADASGNQAIIPGGGTGFVVTADAPFTQVFAWADGADGYYWVELDAPRDSVDLILVYGSSLAENQYDFRFAVGDGAGPGDAQSRLMGVVTVGTGDVQVSVSWDAPSDVDLYVVDPQGEEIYYGNRQAASGGELDLDSNAACHGPDVQNENITWPEDSAPRGEYTVRVNHWDNCEASRTNWVVTVQVRGQVARTYTGSFTGAGNQGGAGAGELVTTFVY